MRDEILQLQYHNAVHIWERFCELHQNLYSLTCDEYQTLLSGEIESLETLITKKEKVIAEINHWEASRAALISELNEQLDKPITSVSELLLTLKSAEEKLAIPALQKLNTLLIDIITKIQDQNKKNQIFLNRAMSSLKDLRDGFRGKKQFNTYGADGMTRSAGR